MYAWFERHAGVIGSVSALFSALGVIIALVFSTLSLLPQPKAPLIDLFSTRTHGEQQRLIIHNSGDGPCVELTVAYPSDSFSQVTHILNYQQETQLSGQTEHQEVGRCDARHCVIDVGYLGAGELLPLSFYLAGEIAEREVAVRCGRDVHRIALFRADQVDAPGAVN